MYDEKFEDLVGKTLIAVMNSGDEVIFETNQDETYVLCHDQDCCESVRVEDVCGELGDLIGSPILLAEEAVNPEEFGKLGGVMLVPETLGGEGSETWTFYKLSTIKGSVTIRWYGTSNGYYSESVSFHKR